jgi:hypothetical protein
MSNDLYHQETYEHKNGKKYHVCWYYDYDMGSPLENGDGYGVTERLDWNPTNEEQLEQHIADYEPELEEETRLRLMRQLQRPAHYRDKGLFYDVLSSLHVARTEWGITDPVKAIEAVEKDFKYLKGWYNDEWHYLTLGVAPIDEDGEVLDHDREFCGGYETLMIHDPEHRASVVEAIEDRIWQIDRAQKSQLHKNQLELCFA